MTTIIDTLLTTRKVSCDKENCNYTLQSSAKNSGNEEMKEVFQILIQIQKELQCTNVILGMPNRKRRVITRGQERKM